MTEAARKAIDFAFSNLGLVRVNIFAAVNNIASNKTIRKLGFTFEGMQKKALRSKANGEYYDKNMYGLLKEDWKNI